MADNIAGFEGAAPAREPGLGIGKSRCRDCAIVFVGRLPFRQGFPGVRRLLRKKSVTKSCGPLGARQGAARAKREERMCDWRKLTGRDSSHHPLRSHGQTG